MSIWADLLLGCRAGRILFGKKAAGLCRVPAPHQYGLSWSTDFVTEIWWDDVESVRAFYKSDEYKNVIQPDEGTLGTLAQGSYFDEVVRE